ANTVQANHPAYYVAIGAEALPPDAVGEDDDGRRSTMLIAWIEVAAEHGRDAEHAEEIRGGRAGLDLDGILGGDLQHTAVAVERRGDQGDAVDLRDAVPKIGELGVRQFADQPLVGFLVVFPEQVDAVLVRKRQRVQDNSFDKRKHRDAETDAELENPDGEQVRAAVTSVRAKREFHSFRRRAWRR